jgi:hypothetical protein
MKNKLKQLVKSEGRTFAYYTAGAVMGTLVYTYVCGRRGYVMGKPVYNKEHETIYIETFMLKHLYEIRAFKK